ncbi:MAG TPA: hypothetical protein VIF57_30525 [Polyangia bacterium]|jgi:hypothetical protein
MGPSEPTNPYEAPQAELNAPVPAAGLPANIENAVAGGYDFTVGEVMDEAWRLTKGMKGTFWGAAIVIGVIYLVTDAIFGVVLGLFLSKDPGVVAKQAFEGMVGALMTPFTVGVYMMCVRRALGQPISFGTAFSYVARARVLIPTALLVFAMTALGLALLLIPGIYLAVGYQLAEQLVCDQGLPTWKAMETSRRAIHHKWWSVFGLLFLVSLLVGVSALGLLIPLIWTLPWMFMTTAVLYRRIFYAPVPVEAELPKAGPPVVPVAPA